MFYSTLLSTLSPLLHWNVYFFFPSLPFIYFFSFFLSLFILFIYFLYLFYLFILLFLFFPLLHGSKKWFHPGSNRGPSLRQSDVITNYTMKPNKHKNDMYYTKQYIWNHFLLSLLSLLSLPLSPPLFLFLCSPSCFVLFCFVLFSFLSFFFYFIYFIYIFYNIMLCCVVLCCIDSGSIL